MSSTTITSSPISSPQQQQQQQRASSTPPSISSPYTSPSQQSSSPRLLNNSSPSSSNNSNNNFNNNNSTTGHSNHSQTSELTSPTTPRQFLSDFNDIDIPKVAQFFENDSLSVLEEDTWKEMLLCCFVPSSQQLTFKRKKYSFGKKSQLLGGNSSHPLTMNETQNDVIKVMKGLDNTSKGTALMDLSGLHHISSKSLFRLKQLLYYRFFFYSIQNYALGNVTPTEQSNASGTPHHHHQTSSSSSSQFLSPNSLSTNTRNSIRLARSSTRFGEGGISHALGSEATHLEMSKKEFSAMKEEQLDAWKQFKFTTNPALKPMWVKFLTSTRFTPIQKCSLMHLASKYNQSLILEWLFDECGNESLFAVDTMKMTPLFYTSFFNATESCAFLCTKIKNASMPSRQRKQSNEQTSSTGRKPFFKSKSDSPTTSNNSTFQNSNALEKIIQQVDDEYGYNVFYVALKRGCFAVCDMLILFGATLDTTIRGGETMLHRACFELPLDRIVYLIQKGAVLLKKDQKGCMPLFNLIGREIEAETVPTSTEQHNQLVSPRKLTQTTSTTTTENYVSSKDVTNSEDHTTSMTTSSTLHENKIDDHSSISTANANSSGATPSVQVEEDSTIIDEFLENHSPIAEKHDKDAQITITAAENENATNVAHVLKHLSPKLNVEGNVSPSSSADSSDSMDIFRELDEMFMSETGQVDYQVKNKLLTSDNRKKREPVKLPTALKMRSNSLNAISAGYTPPGLLEDIKLRSSPIVIPTSNVSSQTNSNNSNTGSSNKTLSTVSASSTTSSSNLSPNNGSRFPNHISHCLQDEFSLKKNIMFKAMEQLVPQMGWSSKTLILAAKKFYGLSEQEARDLFYNEASVMTTKLMASASRGENVTAKSDSNHASNPSSSSLENSNSDASAASAPQALPFPRPTVITPSHQNILTRKHPLLEMILPYISREQFCKTLKSQNYHGRNILHECVIKGDLKTMQLIVNDLLQPRKSTLGSALKVLSHKNSHQQLVELSNEQKLLEKQRYDEESMENIFILHDLLIEVDNDKSQTCLAYACAEGNSFAVKYLISVYNIVGVQMMKTPPPRSSNSSSTSSLASHSQSVSLLSPRSNDGTASTISAASPSSTFSQKSSSTMNLDQKSTKTLLYKVLHMKNKHGKTPLEIAKSSHGNLPCEDIIEMLATALEKSGTQNGDSSSSFQIFKRKKNKQ